MKPHEVELRYQEGTRTIQYGGLPVAMGVDPEWGRLLAASAELARVMLSEMGAAKDGKMHDAVCREFVFPGQGCTDGCFRKRELLRRAGVLP